ncbi:hypothetical protein GDO86_009072, partial [Hymenochirus boettgeri]
MKTKMAQDGQQAKNEFNALQSELDRTIHAKKILENEMDGLRQKCCRAEQTLDASQSNETDLKRNLEALRSERDSVKCQYDQKSKEVLKLEEEFHTANQTLRQSQLFVDELKAKNIQLETELKSALDKIKDQDAGSFQNLKATMINMETERDLARELLMQREHHLEELKNNQATMVNEIDAIKTQLNCKEKECKELINTNISLSTWKTQHEQVSDAISRERDDLLQRVKDLERSLQTQNDQVNLLENDKTNLHTQIKTLQDIVDAKTNDLHNQQVAYNEVQLRYSSESQEFKNEADRFALKISSLEKLVEEQKQSSWEDKMSSLEGLLLNEKTVNCELQRQVEEILEQKVEIQKSLNEAEKWHERFVVESRTVESLEREISQKDASVGIIQFAVKEKEEEIIRLKEKIEVLDNDLKSAHKNNQEVDNHLQELNLLQESWSAEREHLKSLISSKEKDIEWLTEENERINTLIGQKMQLQETNTILMNQEKRADSKGSEGSEVEISDDSCADNEKSYEALKLELLQLLDEQCNAKRENERLTKANEELTRLINDLQTHEQSLDNLTDLSVYLKDKESSLNNSSFMLETIRMDLDAEDTNVDAVKKTDVMTIEESNGDLYVEQGQPMIQQQETNSYNMDHEYATNISDLLENISGSHDSSPANDFNHSRDHISPTNNTVFHRNSEDQEATADLPSLTESENNDLLAPVHGNLSKPAVERADNKSELTEMIADFHFQDIQVFKVPESVPAQHSSPSAVQHSTDRKSISLESAADIGKSLEEKCGGMAPIRSEDVHNFKEYLTIYQTELDELKKQHLSEIESWKEMLNVQCAEMEMKLSVEKQQNEALTCELEAAKLELQCLDLSAHSLLSFDTEDISRSLETSNQSICTVLPIGKLSLSNSELLANSNLKNDVDTKSISISSCLESPMGKGEQSINPPRSVKPSPTSKDSPCGKLKLQQMIENLNLHVQQTSCENVKLHQSIAKGEHKIKCFVGEIEALNKQIKMQEAELTGKETANTELQGRLKEHDDQRVEFIQRIESLSHEKQVLTRRAEDLEKERCNISSSMEVLMGQLSDLSGIRESLETSNGNLNEKFLEKANELKRVTLEKANIENHALALEADLDAVHAKCQHLQSQNEEHQNSMAALQERLDSVVAEKSQILQELENLTEEKDELEQRCQKLKEKEEDLESNKIHNRELIRMLETELRALKLELQAAKSSIEKLSAERDSLVALQGLEKNALLETEGLQEQIQQIQEEHRRLLKDSEDVQAQLGKIRNEKDIVCKDLERCKTEKQELAKNLSFAQEEVSQMRSGIEKLKTKIESDEKKKNHLIGKLKEAERNSDNLKDKIENLERELSMSEENLESAILQSESSKEEAEDLRSVKETLETNLNSLRRKVVDLEKELEKHKERTEELESKTRSISNALEKSEMEKEQLNVESNKELSLLQTQIRELQEQKIFSEERYKANSDTQTERIAVLEQSKSQLVQQLEETQNARRSLELSVEEVTLEFNTCKGLLAEKTEQIQDLEGKLKNAGSLEEKYCAELAKLLKEKSVLDEEHEAAAVRHAEYVAVMGQNNKELLEEAQSNNRNLELSVQKQTLELNEKKEELEERIQQIHILGCRIKDIEEAENKYCTELLCCETERDELKSKCEDQQKAMELLRAKEQVTSEANEISQAAVAELKTTCKDLETQLKSSTDEKQVLLQKV